MPGGGGDFFSAEDQSSYELDNYIFLSCCHALLLSALAGLHYRSCSSRPVSLRPASALSSSPFTRSAVGMGSPWVWGGYGDRNSVPSAALPFTHPQSRGFKSVQTVLLICRLAQIQRLARSLSISLTLVVGQHT